MGRNERRKTRKWGKGKEGKTAGRKEDQFFVVTPKQPLGPEEGVAKDVDVVIALAVEHRFHVQGVQRHGRDLLEHDHEHLSEVEV